MVGKNIRRPRGRKRFVVANKRVQIANLFKIAQFKYSRFYVADIFILIFFRNN